MKRSLLNLLSVLSLLPVVAVAGCTRNPRAEPAERSDLMRWLVWRHAHPPAGAAGEVAVPCDLLLANRSPGVAGEVILETLREKRDVVRRVELMDVRQWKWTPEEMAVLNGRAVVPSPSSVRAEQLRNAARERGCALLLVFESGMQAHGSPKPDATEWAVRQQLRAALVDVESGEVLDFGSVGAVWQEAAPPSELPWGESHMLRRHTRPLADALAGEVLDEIAPCDDADGG